MSKIIVSFKISYRELKSLLCIILMGMFAGLSIVVGRLLTIMPVPTIKISFTFLPNEYIYYLFGPTVGGIFGGILDILNLIVTPTGSYFFGFTLSGILTGVLFGLILYRKPVSLLRIFIATLLRVLIIDLLMNTFWLTVMYGYDFMALLPMRALKNFIMLPIESILLFALIKGLEATGIPRFIRSLNKTE